MARVRRSGAAVLGGLLVLVAGQAAAVEEAEKFGDWRVFTHTEDSGRICFVYTEPTRSQGAEGRKRGQIALQVTHRPGKTPPVYDEVSIAIGYTFREGSEPKLTLGGKPFSLFSQGENAWSRDEQQDKDLVAALRKGGTAVVKAISQRGSETSDTFSLKGFVEAYARMEQICKR